MRHAGGSLLKEIVNFVCMRRPVAQCHPGCACQPRTSGFNKRTLLPARRIHNRCRQVPFQLPPTFSKLNPNQFKMKKSTILESISKLPDEVTIDEIVERLIVIEKIEKGRKEVQAGKVNTEEQAKAKLHKWLS